MWKGAACTPGGGETRAVQKATRSETANTFMLYFLSGSRSNVGWSSTALLRRPVCSRSHGLTRRKRHNGGHIERHMGACSRPRVVLSGHLTGFSSGQNQESVMTALEIPPFAQLLRRYRRDRGLTQEG